MSIFRKLGIFLLLVLFAGGIGKLWHSSKDGFSIYRISYALPPAQGQDPVPPEELFRGPFSYLGRGRQCYAFESPDGRLVLKIPRFDRYELPFFWKMPFAFFERFRNSIREERQRRLAFTLESFKIASEELKEETAILYLHIHDTPAILGRTTLIDKLGRRFEIDLNRTAFVLQEKKRLMMPQFLDAVRAGDDLKVGLIIDSFLAILKKRARLGIFNKDPSFMRNFAWDDGKGVQIDIGSFYRRRGLSPEEAYLASMKESCIPIREWLGSLDAGLLARFDKRLEEECASPY